MKILFFTLFTFVLSSVFTQTSATYFPVKENETWCFYDTVAKNVNPNYHFDTIVFCSNDYKTFYLGVQNDQFTLLNQDLAKLQSGKLKRYFLNGDYIFLKDEVSWKCVSIKSEKIKNIEADSIKQYDNINYIYSKGKVGLITEDAFVLPQYDAISNFVNEGSFEFENGHYLIMNEGKFGLVNMNGQVILPAIASKILREEYEIIKYYEGNWKYLFPDGHKIDPKGCEIHFIDENIYKIYNSTRTKSILYKNHIAVSSTKTYDDFFHSGYGSNLFFKSGGKIGLLSYNFKVIISPIYQQLEEVDNSKYYKYFANGNWGLISEGGSILTPALYQNILEVHETKNGIYLTIAQDEQIGVVDTSGKTIIKCEYDNLIYIVYGYYTLQNNKIGVDDLLGNEIYPCIYSTCYDINLGWDIDADLLIGLEKNGEYLFLTNELKPLNKANCIDFQYFNNALKCYYKDRIEVYFLEKNKVLDVHVYPQMQSVKIKTIYSKNFHGIWLHPNSYLQLNESDALYGAKFNLKSGISYPAIFKKSKASIFTNWFETGIFEDTNVVFSINNFPELIAVNSFQRLNCLNSKFPEQMILGGEFFDQYNTSIKLSSDFSFFANESKINWISNEYLTKTDELIQSKGITYKKDIFENKQLVYIGGSIEIVERSQSEMSLMDYFNYLNKADNLWFPTNDISLQLMNPNLGVKFSNSTIKTKINCTNEYLTTIELAEFRMNELWQIASFRELGKNEWSLTVGIGDKDKTINDVLSYQMSTDDDKEFVILEKKSPVNGLAQKALFSINLKPLTAFIYDDIIYAGELGFLVRQGEIHFYIDATGNRINL